MRSLSIGSYMTYYGTAHFPGPFVSQLFYTLKKEMYLFLFFKFSVVRVRHVVMYMS